MKDRSDEIEVVRWTDSKLPLDAESLVSEAVHSGHAWAADFLAAWRSRPFVGAGEALLLASEAGELLAMAVISADPYLDDRATGRLRFIYVRHTARRRGLAHLLVARCLALGKGHWRRLRLHTDNPVAARLYERYGFQPSSGSDPRATHVRTMPPPP